MQSTRLLKIVRNRYDVILLDFKEHWFKNKSQQRAEAVMFIF